MLRITILNVTGSAKTYGDNESACGNVITVSTSKHSAVSANDFTQTATPKRNLKTKKKNNTTV